MSHRSVRRPAPAALAAALASLIGAAALPPLRAEIVIDRLTAAQSGTSTLDTAEALGGERDLEEVGGFNDAAVGSGKMTCTGSTAFNGCVVEWDGNDNNATDTSVSGFTPVSFSAGGNVEVAVPTYEGSGNCAVSVQLCDGSLCGNNADLMPSGWSKARYTLASFGVNTAAIVTANVAIAPHSATPFNCAVGVPVLRKSPFFEDGFESGTTAAW
jgi:hypothetical protein